MFQDNNTARLITEPRSVVEQSIQTEWTQAHCYTGLNLQWNNFLKNGENTPVLSPGDGATPMYGLDRYVPPERVWFLRVSIRKNCNITFTLVGVEFPVWSIDRVPLLYLNWIWFFRLEGISFRFFHPKKGSGCKTLGGTHLYETYGNTPSRDFCPWNSPVNSCWWKQRCTGWPSFETILPAYVNQSFCSIHKKERKFILSLVLTHRLG